MLSGALREPGFAPQASTSGPPLGHSAPSRELTPGISPRAPRGAAGQGPRSSVSPPAASPSPSRPLQPRSPATGRGHRSAFLNAAPWSGQRRRDPRPVLEAHARVATQERHFLAAEVPEEDRSENSPGPHSPDTPGRRGGAGAQEGTAGGRPAEGRPAEGKLGRAAHEDTDRGRKGRRGAVFRDGRRVTGK